MATNLQSLQRKIVSVVSTATATAGQTVFTTSNSDDGKISVHVNGVFQKPANYTVTNATTITMSEGLEAGDEFTAIIDKIGY